VRRHADSDDLVILAVLLEIKRVVALMAVDNEQSVATNHPSLFMPIKVLDHCRLSSFVAQPFSKTLITQS
jgi:hypothetical protein